MNWKYLKTVLFIATFHIKEQNNIPHQKTLITQIFGNGVGKNQLRDIQFM